MPYNRKAIAPWSTEREQGIESATVDSNIETPQYLQPVVNTGVIDLNGNWIGVRTSDKLFTDFQTDLAIADNAIILSNKTISTYGYNLLNIAIQVSRAGNYTFELLLGGNDDDSYLNLNPINASAAPRATIRTDSATNAFDSLLADQENLADTDVWYVYQVNDINGFQMKLKITNQSGGNSNIQTAIQRLI